MSQQDFAKAIGVAPGSLSSVYSERTQPTNNYVQGIHKAFPDININWLMFGEGEMYVDKSGDVSSSPIEGVAASSDGGRASLFDQPDLVQTDILPFAAPRVSGGSKLEHAGAPQPPQYAPVVTAKDFDKISREVKEIRVFFSDGTYESFLPSK